MLGELLRRHLLDQAIERYRLHDFARAYVRSRLKVSAQHDAASRHAQHFLKVARTANRNYQRGGAGVLMGVALFDQEWANISAAQAWAAAQAEQDAAAAEVCAKLPVVAADCLNLRLPPPELLRWLDAAVPATRRVTRRDHEAWLLGKLGDAYINLGEAGKAIELFQQSRVIFGELGAPSSEAKASWNLGLAYATLGNIHRLAAMAREPDADDESRLAVAWRRARAMLR